MPGKKGVEWLDRKQNTVEQYHHSTYYVFLDQEERHVYDENDSTIAICGGGFPLIIKGELRGCVIVSGLAHDEDHQLIINTLRGYKNESEYTFRADQLFSALYIEALKLECEKQFYDCVKRGKLLFSDAFPYLGKTYMIPKPMIYVEPKVRGISKNK